MQDLQIKIVPKAAGMTCNSQELVLKKDTCVESQLGNWEFSELIYRWNSMLTKVYVIKIQ